MASEHDLGLAARIVDGAATGVHAVDDPAAVVDAASGGDRSVAVGLDDLPAAIAAARVRLAEVVVARAQRAEAELVASVADAGATAPPGRDDVRAADRQAVRFALVILVLALAGGIAVYAADGSVLAPALPALALVALGGVVAAHRRPSRPEAAPGPQLEAVAADVDPGPAQRAAEAHLRRHQAAWKLMWWERGEAVPDLDAWSRPMSTPPVTLVSVDRSRQVDHEAHATMTTAVPAAVRVVVLQPRP